MGKKLEIKTLVKNYQLSEVLGQNVSGNKVLSFRFLGLFSRKFKIFSPNFEVTIMIWEKFIVSESQKREKEKDGVYFPNPRLYN